MTIEMRYLMIRVITKRINKGETFDKIIANYKKLTESEIEELRKAIIGE